MAVEPPEHFALMTRFLEALRATMVGFPAADVCCGSYQVLANPEASKHAASRILRWAEKVGAAALSSMRPPLLSC